MPVQRFSQFAFHQQWQELPDTVLTPHGFRVESGKSQSDPPVRETACGRNSTA
jgi:hypothetical protein